MPRNQRLPWSVLMNHPLVVVAVASLIGTAPIAGAADLCRAPYNPTINRADFLDAKGKPIKIDNRYFPLQPGTTFTYQGTNNEREVLQVTTRTKTILGVTTTVVTDEATVNGQLAEQTSDWFAQDKNGNVWYFGEDTMEFPGGSTAGSWEAGKNGAKPGIIMEGSPRVGDAYRQEFAQGVAEDVAEVRSLDSDVSVPYGAFGDALNTRDGSCIEAGLENKYYAPGVGSVLEIGKGKERLELVSVTH